MRTDATDRTELPEINFQELQQQARSKGPVAPQDTLEAADTEERAYDAAAAEAERWQAENKGLSEYYGLRRRWSRCLECLLIGLVIFQCFLVLAVGFQWMDFSKYQAFLKLQAGVYFVQIVSLCVIVVRFLFSPPAAPKT